MGERSSATPWSLPAFSIGSSRTRRPTTVRAKRRWRGEELLMNSPTADASPIPSFYDAYAPPAPAAQPLEGSHRLPVAILGPGVTGLFTDLPPPQPGLRP